MVLPYVIGSNGVYEQVTSWELINEKTELVVLWGADPTITNDIDWCTTIHENAGGLRALKARGVKVVAINPLKLTRPNASATRRRGSRRVPAPTSR